MRSNYGTYTHTKTYVTRYVIFYKNADLKNGLSEQKGETSFIRSRL
jgi:hypothetical protein